MNDQNSKLNTMNDVLKECLKKLETFRDIQQRKIQEANQTAFELRVVKQQLADTQKKLAALNLAEINPCKEIPIIKVDSLGPFGIMVMN